MTRRAACVLIGIVTASVAAFASQAPRSADESIHVRDAWVRASTAHRTSSSGYCRLENITNHPVALVRITAANVGDARVHAMADHGGQMSMHPVDRLSIPPHGAIDLAPGGMHIMLTDISKPLAIGDALELRFSFDDGHSQTVRAVVRPLDAMSIR